MRVVTRQDIHLYLAVQKDPVLQAVLRLALRRMDELDVDVLPNDPSPNTVISA